MRKFFYLAITFLFVSNCSYGQLNAGEQFHNNLLQYRLDSLEIINDINVGADFQNSYVDSALFFSEKALKLSRKINFLKGQALALNLEGVVFVRLGNYSKALEIFLEALRICEKISIPKANAMVLTNLGDLYYKQKDIKKALEYSFKAKEIFESINDTLNISANYINIGNYYEVENQYDSARVNSQLGFEYAQKVHNESYMGSSMNNLANINAKTLQYPLAREYYKLSLPYFIHAEDYEGICESYLGLANVFEKQHFNDSSIAYAKKSLAIATSQQFIKYIYDASGFITEYYKSHHNIDSAFAYQQVMIGAKDTLFSQDKVKQLQSLSIGETLRQQELADEKIKAEQDRQNNLQYMAIAVFIFLFGIVILFVSRRQVKLATVNFMVTVALLLFFEFISLFMHPYISNWTHHSPVFMLLILVVVAAMLVPMHHRLEHWIKDRLSHKIILPKTKKLIVKKVQE